MKRDYKLSLKDIISAMESIEKFVEDMSLEELNQDDKTSSADLVQTLAPEHDRSNYGEPSAGLTPSDLYREHHALDALENSKKAKKLTEDILKVLNIKI